MTSPLAETQPKMASRYEGPVARTDGTFPSAIDMVRNVNQLFDTGEEGEVSFIRGTLRCLGHCAIGTPEEDMPLDSDIPPVNPWKLIKTLSKATVNKAHRREMMTRIKEGMSIGDSLGLLGALMIYDAGKHSGMSPEQARHNAWDFYGKLGGAETKPKQ